MMMLYDWAVVDYWKLRPHPFSFENAYISMRWDLPSTLIPWAFSSKTHDFKTLLKMDQTKTHTYRIKVEGRKRSKCIKRWQKVSWVRVFVAFAYSSTYVTKCNSIVFERFSVDSRKRVKTVVWTRIDRCVFYDNENAYFWKRISVEKA